MGKSRLLLRVFFPATLFLLAGCEKPFEPLAPSDLAFSIYGHLDAAADTQWVRVMPIRASVETRPGPVDAIVTLEELETGTTVVMSDSMFRYLPLFLGDGGLYAHNFSTTMPMVPGRRYRLTATRSDGAAASATVLIPVFQDPRLEIRNAFKYPSSQNSTQMQVARGRIWGTRHFGLVLGRENIPERCNWPFPSHQQFLPITVPAAFEGDAHQVQLSWGLLPEDSRPSYVAPHPSQSGEVVDDRGNLVGGLCNLEPKQILAIASGDVWPYGASTQLRELSHPASVNSIEGGIGFLAGVQTHVFPFAGCIPLERTSACTITFDSSSATLVGLVTDRCTGEPIGPVPPDHLPPRPVRVQLLGPPENGIRYDTADASSVFRFEGLKPGAAHTLTLAQIPPFPPPSLLSAFMPDTIENVVLNEAAVDTIEIQMSRRRNCPA